MIAEKMFFNLRTKNRISIRSKLRKGKTEHVGNFTKIPDVDKSDDAVIELARKYAALRHQAKGKWPGGALPFKHPCPDSR
jgi:hypothetical protein